jgi:hypothetical protein
MRIIARERSFLIAVLLVSLVVGMLVWLDPGDCRKGDSQYYVNMAEGRVHDVVKPFTNRVLHPAMAAAVRRAASIGTESSFLVIGVLSLLTLVTAVSWLARTAIPQVHFLTALLLTPFLIGLSRQYCLPDMLHAAILGLVFLCLARDKLWPTLALLFFLYVTRESTILLSVTITAVGLYKRRWRLLLGTIIVTALGMGVVHHFSSLGQPNVHGTSDLAYMLLKIPYNFPKNVLGIVLWTNTLAAFDPIAFSDAPIMTMAVPDWLRCGAIRSVGVYAFDPLIPLSTLRILLTSFGVLPILVLADLAKYRKGVSSDVPVYVFVAIVYGLASFFLGTSLGASVGRLVGYGWPGLRVLSSWSNTMIAAVDSLCGSSYIIRSLAGFPSCWEGLVSNNPCWL